MQVPHVLEETTPNSLITGDTQCTSPCQLPLRIPTVIQKDIRVLLSPLKSGYLPADCFFPAGNKIIIDPIFLYQILMFALLHDPSFVNYNDLVCVSHCL